MDSDDAEIEQDEVDGRRSGILLRGVGADINPVKGPGIPRPTRSTLISANSKEPEQEPIGENLATFA